MLQGSVGVLLDTWNLWWIISGDSWMFPGPNVPRHGKSLKISPITWVFMGKLSPRIPREHNKYYCWWLKSCTTKDDDYPIIYRVLTIPGGAGFQPSTVWVHCQGYTQLSPDYKASCESTENFMGLSEGNLEETRADRLSIRDFLKTPYNHGNLRYPPQSYVSPI